MQAYHFLVIDRKASDSEIIARCEAEVARWIGYERYGNHVTPIVCSRMLFLHLPVTKLTAVTAREGTGFHAQQEQGDDEEGEIRERL